MASLIEPISVAGVVELLTPVWIELAMFSLATVVYLASSTTILVKPKGHCSPPGSPRLKCVGSPRLKPYVVQHEQATARAVVGSPPLGHGTPEHTVAILSMLSDAAAREHLAKVGPQLLLTVARASAETDAIALLAGKFEASTLEAAVADCIKRRDFATCRRLYRIAGAVSAPKNQRTLVAFAKAFNRDATLLRSLVMEADTPLSKPFAEAVLKGCSEIKDPALVADVFERVSPTDVAALRIFAADAIAVTEVKQAKAIQSLSISGDLAHAIGKFEKLSRRGGNTSIFNSIIEACIMHNDFDKAVVLFAEAQTQGCADATTYNTMMRAYTAAGQPQAAERLSAELAEKGFRSSRVLQTPP